MDEIFEERKLLKRTMKNYMVDRLLIYCKYNDKDRKYTFLTLLNSGPIEFASLTDEELNAIYNNILTELKSKYDLHLKCDINKPIEVILKK